MTCKQPDIQLIFEDGTLSPNVKNIILDGEIVAYDNCENRILPFQKLAHRQKRGVDVQKITIQIVYIVFDVLF